MNPLGLNQTIDFLFNFAIISFVRFRKNNRINIFDNLHSCILKIIILNSEFEHHNHHNLKSNEPGN